MFQDCVLVWTALWVLSRTSFHKFWTAALHKRCLIVFHEAPWKPAINRWHLLSNPSESSTLPANKDKQSVPAFPCVDTCHHLSTFSRWMCQLCLHPIVCEHEVSNLKDLEWFWKVTRSHQDGCNLNQGGTQRCKDSRHRTALSSSADAASRQIFPFVQVWVGGWLLLL